MRQRLPGQAGNGRKACTQFRHRSNIPARRRATHPMYLACRRPGDTGCMGCEVSWFSALCDDDYEFLGVPEAGLLSSWEHCRDIALVAEQAGYDNLCCRLVTPWGSL